MSKLKNAMPEEYFDLVEAYNEGELSEAEFDRLSKKVIREALEKVLNG